MQPESDAQLLAGYAERGDECAFAEIVARHANLVYSAALRQVNLPDLAAEVAQQVFIGLARGAQDLSRRLAPDASLAGWLCRSARNLSLNLRRDEFRRHSRERQAMEHPAPTPETAPDWEHLRPVLDEAMSELSEPDYDALVMRFFKNQDLRSVGLALGLSDDAAQKRVSRALDKLRGLLSQRGIATSATALSTVLSANAVQVAPAGLAATLSTAALAGTTLATTATATATKAIAMTTLQKTLIAATLVAAVGTGIYEARQASTLRNKVQILEQQQIPLVEQVQQLTKDRDEASRQLAALRDDNERLNRNTAELLKLRGENIRLKADAQELAKLKASFSSDGPAAESWLARVNLLKQRLEQTPEARIPELRYLNEYDWLNAARSDLKTDKDFRRALSWLRTSGESKFATQAFMALQKYSQANSQKFPTELSQLLPYFSPYHPAVDDAILQRWEIVPATNGNAASGGDWVITQKAPVDEDYDQRQWIGPKGNGGVGAGSFKMPQVKEVVANTNLVKEMNINPFDATAVFPAMKAFSAANNGQQPTNASQLLPYLTTPEQRAALLRLSGEMGAVGVALSTQGENEPPRIQRIVSASSAEKAGIEPGSFLLSIDGVNTAGKSMAEWTGMIRGKVGTTVTLEVVNPAMSRTNRFTLTRAKM